jgi:hypothetical protein
MRLSSRQLVKECASIDIAQVLIHQEQVKPELIRQSQRFPATPCRSRAVPLVFEQAFEFDQDIVIVIYDQDSDRVVAHPASSPHSG